MSSIDYWMKQAEKWKIRANTAIEAGDKRIAELEALNAKQGKRIADLEAAWNATRNEADAITKELQEKLAETGQRVETAEAENVKLREALLIYGCHTSECQRECVCGYEAALNKGGGG